MKNLVKGIVVLLLVAGGFLTLEQAQDLTGGSSAAPAPSEPSLKAPADHPTGRGTASDNAELERAIQAQRSDVILTATARIKRVLPDDTKGSQHQRLLLDIGDRRTVLVAHNIDLAPRVPNPQEGDLITVHGEFEWNDRGGVIHWTHHDPRGRHEGGWIEYRGKRYE